MKSAEKRTILNRELQRLLGEVSDCEWLSSALNMSSELDADTMESVHELACLEQYVAESVLPFSECISERRR